MDEEEESNERKRWKGKCMNGKNEKEGKTERGKEEMKNGEEDGMRDG